MTTEILREIRESVERQPLVDTHEHLVFEDVRNAQRIDFLSGWLGHYASSDLVSAGMSVADLEYVRDITRPFDARWAKFAAYWPHVRTTGYGRALLIAARDLHGVENIDDSTAEALAEKVAASNRPGWYRKVLRERAGIAVGILDVQRNKLPGEAGFRDVIEADVDPEMFVRSVRFERFIMPRSRKDLRDLESATDVAIHSLDDLVEALEVGFERVKARGQMVAIKNALAYVRSLVWERTSHHDAEVAYLRATSHVDELRERRYPEMGASWTETKPLQDFMMHQTVRLAIEHGLPMQIHTGLQEGNGNVLMNSRPTDLTNLFLEYPEARFDLFHAGYPWSGEVAALAKNFPNVYADLCWVHVISPTVGRRVLREWLETVPSNKILAFGGDYLFPEGAYGHAVLARQGVARVLAETVDDEYLTRGEALALVPKLLHDNAAELFKLERRVL
jgi:uncharacterized protein